MEENSLLNYLSNPTKKNAKTISKMEHTAWAKEDVALNWINVEYPYLHTHDHYEILIIISGQINHFIDGKNYVLNSGDACLIRPDNNHKLCFNKNVQSEYLHINLMLSRSLFDRIVGNYSDKIIEDIAKTDDFSPFKLSGAELEDIKKYAIRIHAFKEYSELDVLLCKTIINRLLAFYIEQKYFSKKQSIPGWLNDFLKLLYSPQTFELSITELAKNTPYSQSRLYRIFKNYFNTTIIEYRNNIKLEYAKELLTNTQESALEICNRIGFYSLSHFDHAFKKKFGISPIQFRKLN